MWRPRTPGTGSPGRARRPARRPSGGWPRPGAASRRGPRPGRAAPARPGGRRGGRRGRRRRPRSGRGARSRGLRPAVPRRPRAPVRACGPRPRRPRRPADGGRSLRATCPARRLGRQPSCGQQARARPAWGGRFGRPFHRSSIPHLEDSTAPPIRLVVRGGVRAVMARGCYCHENSDQQRGHARAEGWPRGRLTWGSPGEMTFGQAPQTGGGAPSSGVLGSLGGSCAGASQARSSRSTAPCASIRAMARSRAATKSSQPARGRCSHGPTASLDITLPFRCVQVGSGWGHGIRGRSAPGQIGAAPQARPSAESPST